ncbi:MAG: ABC transporter permease [Actinomycetota bacterium]|jgi:peptide/nickel transport system permease protein|nr:ABC transporter permease [Actinomycetota bacterium]
MATTTRAPAPERIETLPVLTGQDDQPSPRRHPLVPRLLTYVLALFLLVNLNFLLPRVLPGDPIEALFAAASPTYVRDDVIRAELTAYYGLDGSLADQYLRYLSSLSRGDLGVSIRENASVADLLAARLPWTALLISSGLVLSAVVGLVAGVHSGWRRGRRVDRRLLTSFVVLSNVPTYVLASLALLVFAVKLQWLPLSGGRTPFLGSSGVLVQFGDIARHLLLPALIVAVSFVAYQYLVMRGSMVSELGADYLLLGRAKGVRERSLKYRYAARNAVLPVVTLQALQLRAAVGAAIFVETVFAYPGLGLLLAAGVAGRDYPLMQGAFLLLSFVVLTANLLIDLLYGRLDPRTAM